MSDLHIGAWSDDLLDGLWVTVYMTVLSAALAAAIALVLGLLARMEHLAPRTFARVVIEFFRGTSLLVQLFSLFYALPLWGYQLDPVEVGVVAFGLNFGAYGAEVVRGSINAVPRAQWEGAIALSLSPFQRMRRVILPQAFPLMIPPFGNLLIQLIKSTPLLFLVTLAPLTAAFIEFVRSTPIPIQLFFLFYVMPSLGLTLSGLVIGVLTLGVHYACYYAEVYRAGIDGVPKGQWEACTALSVPTRYQWQHVVLPQAIRNVLPSLGNYVISMFKETPFLYLISVPEMVQEAISIGGRDFRYLEPVTIAGLIFLAASYPSAVAMRKLEKRLGHA